MQSLRVQNFRSLVDTGPVAIKPITVLVGSNSSGKSTFLRTLPLLRQSVETTTSSPILWFGRYVDFGSIEDAEGVAARGTGVTFEFLLELDPRFLQRGYVAPRQPGFSIPVTVSITIKKRGNDGNADIVACSLDVDGLRIAMEFDKGEVRKFTAGDYDATAGTPLEVVPGAIIPSVRVKPTAADASALSEAPTVGGIWYRNRRLRTNEVVKAVSPFVHQNTAKTKIQNVIMRVRVGTSSAMLRQLKELSLGPKWHSTVSTWTENSYDFRRLREKILADTASEILVAADAVLAEVAANVLYMGPFRAAAQRYYRVQDLAISEIDFRGENLAMFLRSLREDERAGFSAFVSTHFGIEVQANSTPGHVGVFVRESPDKSFVNLADTGFGYSQLLPVVAQLWSAFSGAKRRRAQAPAPYETLVAVEQPELHLHPAHQARLADLYVGAVRAAAERKLPIRLVIETHSEAIVNRLGELVRSRAIESDDVQVLVFDRDPSQESTTIQTATFAEDGALANWPYGFFLPSV